MSPSLSTPAIGRFDPRRGVRWLDVLPVFAVVALTAALIAILPRPLSSDVAGQLWIAHRLREGARLYVDIAEVNPPLWFWLAVPVDWIAERLRTAPEGVLIAACGAAALASLLATGRLLAHVPAPKRSAFLVYAAAVLLIGPARDIGQRELFVLFAALPYAALVAARREGRTVSWRLALLVGVGGAVGFALKHYFLGVPVLLELWLLATLRRGWRPVRAETLALAGTGLAYAAAVVVVTPAYLAVTVPQLRFAYGAATAPPWRAMILAQAIWLVLLLAIVTQRRALRLSPLAVALLIAGAGFAAAWAIQHKGWPYHAIPATATLALALAALLAEAWERVGETARKLAVATLVLPLALAAMPTHAPVTPGNDIAPLLAGLQRGDAVALISTEGFTAWPAAVTGGYRWSSRYPQYWMLGAIDARGASDPRVARFGREVVRDTAVDYRCLPPLRIIVARPDPASGTASGDPLRYFLRDPEFAGVMRHYGLWKRYGIFDAYAPTTPLAPTVRGCRR